MRPKSAMRAADREPAFFILRARTASRAAWDAKKEIPNPVLTAARRKKYSRGSKTFMKFAEPIFHITGCAAVIAAGISALGAAPRRCVRNARFFASEFGGIHRSGRLLPSRNLRAGGKRRQFGILLGFRGGSARVFRLSERLKLLDLSAGGNVGAVRVRPPVRNPIRHGGIQRILRKAGSIDGNRAAGELYRGASRRGRSIHLRQAHPSNLRKILFKRRGRDFVVFQKLGGKLFYGGGDTGLPRRKKCADGFCRGGLKRRRAKGRDTSLRRTGT